MDTSPAGIRTLRGPLTPATFAEQIGVSALSVRRWELPDGDPEARRPRRASRERLRHFANARAGVAPNDAAWLHLLDGGRWQAARDAVLDAGRGGDPERIRVVLGTVALLSLGDVDAALSATVSQPGTPRGAALAAWLAAWPDGRVLDPDGCRRAAAAAAAEPSAAFLAALAVAHACDHVGDEVGFRAAVETLPPQPDGPVPACLADAVRARLAHLSGRAEEARVRWRAVANRAGVLRLGPTEVAARIGLVERMLLDGASPAALRRATRAARGALTGLRPGPRPAAVLLSCLEAELHLRAGHPEAARAAIEHAEGTAETLRWSAPGAWPARLRLAMETGDAAATRARHPLGGPAAELALQGARGWLEGDRTAGRMLAATAALARTTGTCPALEALAGLLAAIVDPTPSALARASATLARHPSTWLEARLGPARATHHRLEGREDEATWALQAALPVLEAAGDGAAAAAAGIALSGLEDGTVAATPIERLIGPVTRLASRSGGARALLTSLMEEVAGRVPKGTGVELWERDQMGRDLLVARRGEPEPRPPTLDRPLVDATGRVLRLRVGPLRRGDRAAVVLLVEVAQLALRAATRSHPKPRLVPPSGRHPLLLLIEAGTDAEAIARRLHGDGPFVVVGRDQEESAGTGGIRFVPEVGDLDPEAALRLASMLGDASGPDVIAATVLGLAALERTAPELHRALAANAVPVAPLRQRAKDLLSLATEVAAAHGVAPPDAQCRALLLERPWPGNEAQVKDVVTRAAQSIEPGQSLSVEAVESALEATA